MLDGKMVLLGVSGGIAAYKAVDLCSRLVKQGAEVHVLMTAAATRFVAPLTFQAISGHPVHTDILAEQQLDRVDHVHLARRADLLVVAPATANVLARMAAGMADDHVTAAALGVTCPVLVCPAMEEHMWLHPQTQANVRRLEAMGHRVMPPAHGRLASGLTGQGRLPEPAELEQEVLAMLASRRDLAGRRVLVTAGPTREPLDPFRYISNPSSGKMGYAIALAALRRGAEVVLVAGPTELPDPPGVTVVRVQTALEMHAACLERAEWYDAAVGAAAVSDYRPAVRHPHKVKKADGPVMVELVRTPDIMADLGAGKRPGQITVGFAAETRAVAEYARGKLAAKHLDMIVANDVSEPGSGFVGDTNRVTLHYRDGRAEELPLMSKAAVAEAIWDRVAPWLAGPGPAAPDPAAPDRP